MTEKIRIGVSSCLLGQEVRYDGGHKRDRFLTDTLGPHVEWVPVCPELEVGMGVPREPVRLSGPASAPRMIGTGSGEDWTARMREYSKRRAARLGELRLSGYILKSRSPSCGMERVKIHNAKGVATKEGVGLFARELMEAQPLLPVEEEGRLNDPHLRDSFIVRVFAYHRLRTLLDSRFTTGKLVAFHTAEKYLLLAHSPSHCRELGALVANAKKAGAPALKQRYAALFMECLAVRSTVKKNVNVLQHMVGFLPETVPAEERREILQVIEDYRSGLVPLVVPVTIVRHYVRSRRVAWVMGQSYLDPHPKELMLRNRV